MTRSDGRANDELRSTTITLGAQAYAEGSVIIETGMTKVLCAVSVENRVPTFLRGSGKGWVTSEYAMLPRATHTRNQRETTPRGRTQEIQRLIGRSLRAVVDMDKLGERTLTVDCDVIQADGGTRTASITGAYVALYQAFHTLVQRDELDQIPLNSAVAATSVGILDGEVLLDLCYDEDFKADGDFNIVMTGEGEFVEVQGTAEGKPFSQGHLDKVLSAAGQGIDRLFELQKEVIARL
ncbi:MAG: ribonuclease PH [Chloroflexi bacterium]|nr:ribonuclease PH [Chloroflexota bacterium]MDA1226702.1 ribonuclease PH [Chloroflexota bacterium]